MGMFKKIVIAPRETITRSIGLISIGLICGILGSYGWAALSPPTEHKGLEVEQLGFVPGESVSAQVGLTGYKLSLSPSSVSVTVTDDASAYFAAFWSASSTAKYTATSTSCE